MIEGRRSARQYRTRASRKLISRLAGARSVQSERTSLDASAFDWSRSAPTNSDWRGPSQTNPRRLNERARRLAQLPRLAIPSGLGNGQLFFAAGLLISGKWSSWRVDFGDRHLLLLLLAAVGA